MRTEFLFAFLLLAPAAYPCGCAGPTPLCSVYWTTPVVFVGHVTSQQFIDGRLGSDGILIPNLEIEVHFYVDEPLKGIAGKEPGKEIVVRTHSQGSACGFEFENGSEYLVFAYSRNGEWWTDKCTRTQKIESANDDPDVQWIRGLAKEPPGGTIFGTIQSISPGSDVPDVSPLPNIKVTVTGPISHSTNTDNAGQFEIAALPPGTYTVSAVAPTGYAAFSTEAISPKVSLHDRGCAEVPFYTQLDGHITGHVYFSNGVPAVGLDMTAHNIDISPWLSQSSSTTTSGKDGSFDFSGLAPGRYVFGVNTDLWSFDDRYYRKAFYPGVAERSQATLVQLERAQKVDNLRFFLPQDLPAPSIPLQVTVLGRDGKLIPNVEVQPDDVMWENVGSNGNLAKKTDSEGTATLLLRKGAYYKVWAVVNLPGGQELCAEPVGVLAEEGLKRVVLIVNHSFGNCSQFKKRRH